LNGINLNVTNIQPSNPLQSEMNFGDGVDLTSPEENQQTRGQASL
jgi:hypothetical protein